MFGFLKKAIRAVAKSPLVKVGGTAALLVPGGGQVVAGVQIADTVVKAASGKPHHKVERGRVVPVRSSGELKARQAKARAIIAQTQKLAVQGPTRKVRRAARAGLALMAKRAAALRFTQARFRVNPRGVVIKIGA